MKTLRPLKKRRGQALVEFAFVSIVLTAMLAGFLGLIALGLSSFQTHIAAESAGRLLDRRLLDNRLPGTPVTAQEVYDELLNENLYDETELILTPGQYYDSDYRSTMPELNRILLPSFIFDRDLNVYRYPGAVVTNANGQRTILVPLLPHGVAKGIDRSFNVDVSSFPVSDDWVGPVCIASTNESGVFRLILFHASQPAATINFEVVRDAEGRVVSQTPVLANDSAITLSSPPAGYTLIAATGTNASFASAARGQYGLGEVFAFNASVRPFRVVFESSTRFRLADE